MNVCKWLIAAIAAGTIGAVAILVDYDPPTAEEFTVKVEITTGGHGSGVVVGDGLLLTARHVATNGPMVVHDNKGNKVPGYLVWSGPEGMTNDLAMVRFDATKLKVRRIPINCHNTLEVGDKVQNYGYPMYMGIQRTNGLVSGYLGRIIVADGTIGPGNSGGPMVHDGELVGITVAMPMVPIGFFGAALLPYTLAVGQNSICRALNKPYIPMSDVPDAPEGIAEPTIPPIAPPKKP